MLIQEYYERFAAAAESRDWNESMQLSAELRARIQGLDVSALEVSAELSSVLAEENWLIAEDVLIAASSRPSAEYVPTLCQILALRQVRAPNEGIAELLGELKDRRAVPFLLQAISYHFENDPNHNLGHQCVHALARINTTEAHRALQEVATNGCGEISTEARELLEKKDHSG